MIGITRDEIVQVHSVDMWQQTFAAVYRLDGGGSGPRRVEEHCVCILECRLVDASMVFA